jgi:hydroxymethylbilane synthase
MLIRAATRGSALARWQTDHVAALLRAVDPTVEVEVVVVETSGDHDRESSIAEIGGKGVFVKEVQTAVLDGRADIAVHSAKDLPAVTPDGLVIAAVPLRADPRDAMVGSTVADLRDSAVVGTGSARRRVQLSVLRPDVTFVELRGNMDTRVRKAERDDVDAVVVAACALDRLGWSDRIAERLDVEAMVPQVAQGALAIECRVGDDARRALVARIEQGDSRLCVDAERAFLDELGGDCTLPAGAYAELHDGVVLLRAVLHDGTTLRRVEAEAQRSRIDDLARSTARHLLGQP